jgi:hypothetical protein
MIFKRLFERIFLFLYILAENGFFEDGKAAEQSKNWPFFMNFN